MTSMVYKAVHPKRDNSTESANTATPICKTHEFHPTAYACIEAY
jgi:hypothetical protein